MSFWVAGAIVVTSLYTNEQSKKARKKAKRDAEEDALEAEKQARKAEAFADTEGQGIGDLGKVSLELDNEYEDEDLNSTGNIRI